MGRLGTISGAPWAVLDAVESKKVTMLNTYVSVKNLAMFVFWGPGRGPLGVLFGRIGGRVGRLETSWTWQPLAVLTLSWTTLALCLVPFWQSWSSLVAPEAPGEALASS